MINTKTVTLILFLLTVVVNFYKVESRIKLVRKRRFGTNQLKFKCKFKTKDDKNVTWTLNDKNIDGYPDFSVTHKHKKKHNLVISVMEILHPKVLFFFCNVRCKMDSVEHVFPSFDGMSNYIEQGKYYYWYDKSIKHPTYTISNFKKYCKIWDLSIYGCGIKDRHCACTFVGLKSTETTSTLPIKPNPFISFSIFNNLTLPKETYYNVEVTDDNLGWLIVENITTSNFIIDKSLRQKVRDSHNPWMELQPNKNYEATIQVFPPFWISFGNPILTDYKITVKSSSLKPDVAVLLNATKINDSYCDVNVQFPSNVDVSDTYEHFLPQFTVDDRIENEVLRQTESVFNVKFASNNKLIRLRILSTVEKYNGDYSNAIKCD